MNDCLYRLIAVKAPNNQALLDVVFVHGLTGGPTRPGTVFAIGLSSLSGPRDWRGSLHGSGEDTKRNLKHVKDRAANLAERPQRVSSVTRITSTLRACAILHWR